MSNSQAFNFADFYKNNNGTLDYTSTIPVASFNLVADVVAQQNSTLECQLLPDVSNGDFGVLKNNKGMRIVFKVLDKQTDDTDNMMLTVSTWIDVCGVSARVPVAEAGTALITDIAGSLQEIVYDYEDEGAILLPYTGTPDAFTEYYKDVDPAKLYGYPEFFRDAVNTGDYIIKVRWLDNKIDFQALHVDDATTHKLNLKDLNVFNTYNVQMSNMEHNILKVYVSDQSFEKWYYRIKADGTVERLIDPLTGESKVVNSDGTYGATSDWSTGIIAEERTGEIIEKGSTVLADALIEVGKKSYTDLKSQYYNHEITAEANLDNAKMDLSDLDGLFSKVVWLYLDGREIRTKITRYEYSGGSAISLKFGNARTALTDKLKKKGII